MATYFHQRSDIQAPDGLQTLVLTNPSYVQFTTADAPHPGSRNLVLLNSASAAGTPTGHLAHIPQQTQQFVGIPLSASSLQGHQNIAQEISPFHGLFPRVHYNLWNAADPSRAAHEPPQVSHSQEQQGGLSLSLSSQQPPGFRSMRSEREPPHPVASNRGGGGGGNGRSSSSASAVTNNGGVPGIQGVLLSSKYLKATQELLDEVVNVGSGIYKANTSKKASSSGHGSKTAGESSSPPPVYPGKEESCVKDGASDLSTAERQEIQMKRAKLINMLDEVEQRYRQYHHQMQIVISSFEQAAGIGSARTYTALALKTISKQFRCLKDAIASQIKAANKSLGEEEIPGGKVEGSRLKFVDHQIRQQRALQQLGMIQHNAWRPQRGLPEHAVSILRAWLFEHFLHPYPKDSDKHMLAKQTGLTRSQVSNWFINARVRLWKPMVEDMYTEEVKGHEQNGVDGETKSKSIDPDEDSAPKPSSLRDKGPPTENLSGKSLKSKEMNPVTHDAPAILPTSASSIRETLVAPPEFALISSSELDSMTRVSPKKPRITDMLHSSNNVPSLEDQLTMKFGDEGAQHGRDGYSLMGGPTNFIGGFGQYPIGEIGRFGGSTTVGIAKVNSEYKDLDIAVVKATNHVECPPKERHIRKIFFATSVVRQRADVAYCIHALSKRLSKTKNWIVALKTLIVIHRTLREGDPIFREELLNYSNRERILQISYFKDDTSPLAWDCSAWVRTYALFLEERLECFRILKFDVETEQLTKTSPGGSKAHSRTRLMASHELLEQLPALQQLLYRLIICYPEGAAYSNFLIQYALALVLKESFKIYCAVNDGIINLVDMFFDMSRHDAVKALNIYKRAGQQAENLADFYEYCKGLELARNFQFPTLRQPPPSFLSTMEEYIKEAPQTGSMVKRLEYRESEETPKEEEPSQPPEVEKEPENVEEENEQINLEEEEEEAKPEEELEAPPLISTETDLLGLNEIHPKAAELEESNALALAIVPPGHNPSPSFGSGWDIISGSNTSGWELALVTAPSNNTQPPMESKLAGGFDKLLLDSLYEDDAARRQIQLQNAGYGPGATAMTPSPNPFDQPDPFVMSNNIAAPTNVQIACLAQQQQQLMFEQQQYYQNQQQNMMVVPYGVQQPSYQQHAPIYGTPMVPQQMDSSNPFGDPFPGISQQRPLQPHENHHLL